MTLLIIRSTLISTALLVALMILTTSVVSASEVSGVLNSSGNAPPSSETSDTSAPVFTGSVNSSSHSEGSAPSGVSHSESAPVNTNTPYEGTSVSEPALGMILSSHTDTSNVPVRGYFVQYAQPQKDSGELALLYDGTPAGSQSAAIAAAVGTSTVSVWWWFLSSLLVLSLVGALYVYRPRQEKKRWIDAQYH